MARYDAVLFDAGETLIGPHPSFPGLLAELLSERGFGSHAPEAIGPVMAETFAALSGAMEGFSLSAELSRRFWTELYGGVLARLGIDDHDGELVSWIYGEFSRPERYRPFPDSIPALRELKREGYRIGLISNWEAWLPSLLDDLGLSAYMETIVVSGVEGFEKPDPRIFKKGLEGLGLPPERVVYVGDSPLHDFAPAEAIGMQPVLLDRRDRFPGMRPRIRSLGELAAVIR